MNEKTRSSEHAPVAELVRSGPPGRPLLLTEEEAARELLLSRRTLQGMRVRGDGPQYVKLGNSKFAPVRYRLEDIIEYLKAQARQSTARGPG